MVMMNNSGIKQTRSSVDRLEGDLRRGRVGCSLPVCLEGVVAPVIGEGDNQLDACLLRLGNNDVQTLEGILVVNSGGRLQVEAPLHREAKDANHVEILPSCTNQTKFYYGSSGPLMVAKSCSGKAS